ncbi:MAG: response regulator [Candidatus Abyssobacteria bacterium SURF_17]|jgi:two-component system response regulator PilR (NtrC family)|uniref:Response regulator n=1 Tax=Candidatus Abyssobacteria bacterium SURF_17 TaxID=2093361 RepID=A0A419EWL2_9BACT|nr:MAG: response regulator [Candidatus Abyssubacteria bacterium SURF_17]
MDRTTEFGLKGATEMRQKNCVLLVDDDREFCSAMKKLLEKAGCEVAVTGDGYEALRVLSDSAFDLIIADLRMPKLGGVEFMEEINRREIDTPVIFVTGYGEVESYMTLMNMGAFDYITKPFSGKELLRIVRRAMEAPDGVHMGQPP